VEDFLPDVDADRGQRLCGGVHGMFLRMLRGSLSRLSRGGSSRSIPLADLATRWLVVSGVAIPGQLC
jgi:hypothetical protein